MAKSILIGSIETTVAVAEKKEKKTLEAQMIKIHHNVGNGILSRIIVKGYLPDP